MMLRFVMKLSGTAMVFWTPFTKELASPQPRLKKAKLGLPVFE
jgi:hypothetical protein